jgi:hypothetical protein
VAQTQYAYGAVAFADFVVALKARLVAVLELPTDPATPITDRYVRVLVTRGMTPAASEFRAERGLTVKVGPAQYMKNCGAGRSGWKITRDVEVFIVSQCLLDQSGDDLEAIKRHLVQEEAVVDALIDSIPADQANANHTGIRLTTGEPGMPMRRFSETDVGVVQSSVKVSCEYPAKMLIYRN